ncbi:MAG: MASE1 domain-containing protein [Gemmatimonadaceae bacterium]
MVSQLNAAHNSRRPLQLPGRIVAIALLYVLVARAGLQLDAVSGFATLVWPPTGLALAAVLLCGYEVWPGVLIGAVVANVLTGAPIVVALGIGVGNTLEVLIGAYALWGIPGFKRSLDRVVDAIGLVALAGRLATVVAASIGVLSLYLGGIVDHSHFGETWRAWWLGDAIGAVFVAPLILVWTDRSVAMPALRRVIEAAALTIAVLLTSFIIFIVPPTRGQAGFNESYIFFPLLIWAAVRFGQRGAVSMTFLVSVIAVWGTALGRGPFIHSTLHASLFALQTFMGVTAATFLVLGASTAERENAVDDLSTAHEVAANANRAKTEFLAVMSHELRTPLNAIAGYSELLALGLDGPLSEKQSDTIARIRRNQRHLLELIEEVLSFAKIEAGSTEIVPQPVLVNDAFTGLEPLVRPQLEAKRLELTRDPIDQRLAVYADASKLQQILLNIIVNAIKFTPRGGLIRLSGREDADGVTMSVADTGIGVPSENLSQIFEPFFQVDSGRTRVYSGVGLGLAIARDLAHAMDGEIAFESVFGQGSVVSVTLPRALVGRA